MSGGGGGLPPSPFCVGPWRRAWVSFGGDQAAHRGKTGMLLEEGEGGVKISLQDDGIYPRSFVLGGKKNLQGGKGKGIRGGKEQ